MTILKRECIAYLQLAKITFYSERDYQGKEADIPTTDPAYQDKCVDIHLLLYGPIRPQTQLPSSITTQLIHK
jgi:hypothetical protein